MAQGDNEFPGALRLCIIGHFVPLSGYLREIRLGAGRIAKKIRKQLAGLGVPAWTNLHRSMQALEK